MAGFIAAMPRRNLSACSSFRAASARSEESRLLLWARGSHSLRVRTPYLPLRATMRSKRPVNTEASPISDLTRIMFNRGSEINTAGFGFTAIDECVERL